MSFEQLTEIVRRLVLGLLKTLYYSKTGKILGLGIKELKSDSDVDAFLKHGYDNGFMVNLYVEHFGYDVIDCLNYENAAQQFSDSSNDEYSSDDGEDLKNVDFTLLVRKIGLFSGGVPKPGSSLPNLPEDDPDGSTIEPQFKVKRVFYGRDIQEGRSIACQCANQIIKDPFIPLRIMKEDIKQKFMIDVSLGQCKRAKQTALYDHERGLIDLYGKLWEYRQTLIDSNSGTTYRLDVEDTSSGKAFLRGCTYVSSGLKMADWLPQAEHKKCTTHLYANFKKRYSGVQFKRLFWGAATSTLVQQFEQRMAQFRLLDDSAYDYLIERNLNSWSKAFFEMDRMCAAFENGILESFNRVILLPRHKPIIAMLEEIRIYIMQRLVAMNKLALNLEDTITPSIRKQLEILKVKQRDWLVYPCGFQELEVGKGDKSYGVDLMNKVCGCRMWELSGVPCVHAMAGYMLLKKDQDNGGRVENLENWCWFLSFLHDDMNLNNGNGLTTISDSHKKRYSGVQFKRLFWGAATSTLVQQFEQRMARLRLLDDFAYGYLIERNPNSWSKPFFEMDRRCAAFENGISESFNRAILLPRHKPIITMLEEIRIYIMQRLVAMNKLALNLEDTITPSIRKQLEILKVKQRDWLVYPSGFQELEVRKGDESYGVDLMNKVCRCRMWELSGVPCVHAMAGYMHLNKDSDNGRNEHQPPLPPIVKRMPGRPQKERIKSPTEESTQVSRVERKMTCSNCWEHGHNKAGCKNEASPQPKKVVRPIGGNRQSVRPQCTSRGGGRGSRGGRIGRGNETMNVNEDSEVGVGRGTTVGRGMRGGGRGRGRKGTGPLNETPTTRYSRGPLTDEQEHYLRQDEEALREHLEEEARVEQEYLNRYMAEQEYEARMDWMHASHWQSNAYILELNPSIDHVQDMQVDDATASSTKKNRKRPMSTDMQVDEITSPSSKQKKDMAPPLPFRIYVKTGVDQKGLQTKISFSNLITRGLDLHLNWHLIALLRCMLV
ncbi:calcium/proton exchanger [Tanacetum coccineum]